jgi:cobalt-zinc-cadmium efflux system protein
VRDIHHVHAWMLTMERPLITLHARIESGADQQGTLHAIQHALAGRFGIEHATVQIETSEECA